MIQLWACSTLSSEIDVYSFKFITHANRSMKLLPKCMTKDISTKYIKYFSLSRNMARFWWFLIAGSIIIDWKQVLNNSIFTFYSAGWIEVFTGWRSSLRLQAIILHSWKVFSRSNKFKRSIKSNDVNNFPSTRIENDINHTHTHVRAGIRIKICWKKNIIKSDFIRSVWTEAIILKDFIIIEN